jgi:hypothetical protein
MNVHHDDVFRFPNHTSLSSTRGNAAIEKKEGYNPKRSICFIKSSTPANEGEDKDENEKKSRADDTTSHLGL